MVGKSDEKLEYVNPIEAIQSELKLGVTMMIRVLASQWDNVKTLGTGLAEHQVYNMLAIGSAHDLMMDVEDYEGAARGAGWKTADMTPGMLVRGVVGQPMAMSAMTWQEACKMDKLVVPIMPVRQVWVVTDTLYAQLSLLDERLTELCGHKLWANHRDSDTTKAFFERLYADRSDIIWSNAITSRIERQRNSLGETDAEQLARDKWEANSN